MTAVDNEFPNSSNFHRRSAGTRPAGIRPRSLWTHHHQARDRAHSGRPFLSTRYVPSAARPRHRIARRFGNIYKTHRSADRERRFGLERNLGRRAGVASIGARGRFGRRRGRAFHECRGWHVRHPHQFPMDQRPHAVQGACPNGRRFTLGFYSANSSQHGTAIATAELHRGAAGDRCAGNAGVAAPHRCPRQ